MNANRRTGLGLLLVALLVIALSACGAGASDDGKVSSASTAGRDAADGGTGSDFDAAAPKPAAEPAANEVIQRSVISTAQLNLTTRKPDDVRRRALAVVTGLRGTVDNEQSTSDDRGRLSDVDLTVRVPSASFEKALDQLGDLGTVEHREQSAEDVTTQVIDIAAKVKSQRETVASFQRLLARAETIGEIMSIENQLTSRQAELDSLVQQQKYLAAQTSMSTIQLHISRTHREKPDEAGGFIGGLEDGWHALGATAVALGTALGAVLPFAVVLALVGVPVWLSVRRIRARARSAA